MSATQYTPDRSDMDFVLHDVLQTVSTLHSYGIAEDMDRELVDSTLAEAARVAAEVEAAEAAVTRAEIDRRRTQNLCNELFDALPERYQADATRQTQGKSPSEAEKVLEKIHRQC